MTNARSKLGPAARQWLESGKAAAPPPHERGAAAADSATVPEIVSVLISVTREMTDDDRRELEAMGVVIRSQAGDVCTASMPATQLTRLAQMPLVRYVDLAAPMYPEPRRPG